MKILTLNLLACGPFTGHSLDLSGGSQGLHVIFGPNEAGKSSALRAISDFFFGFHAKTPDTFIHPYKQLRIGAELQHSSGRVLACVRRKGNQQTLRQADDVTPVDDRELSQLLGDVDRDKFQAMFGLNHERLRKGGADIVKGEGPVGQLLFSAGAGLADLRGVQKALVDKIIQLFTSSGLSGDIIKQTKQYKDARAQLKEAQVSVETWSRHDEDLSRAERQKGKLDETIRDKRAQQNRLTRILNAVPAVSSWRNASAQLTLLGDVPLLADDFARTSNAALLKLRKAEARKLDAEAALSGLRDNLSRIQVPEELLAEADAIEALRNRLGAYQKAVADRPELETSRLIAESDALAILRKLDRAPDLTSIEELHLPADKSVRIHNLGNQQQGLLERFKTARRDCERLRRKIERAESKLRDIHVPVDATALRQAIRQAQAEGDLEKRIAGLEKELAALRQEASVNLQQLRFWSGSLEDIETLSAPGPATIDRFDQELREADRLVTSLRERHAEEARSKDDFARQLERLELDQSVPTLQDLVAARSVRDQGWQLVVQAWKTGGKEGQDVAEFVQQFPSAGALSDAYRKSVEDADQLADLLRSDAERVASKTHLAYERNQRERRCASLLVEIERAEERLLSVQGQWESQWSSLGQSPSSPAEIREWCRKQQDLARQSADIRTRSNDLDQLRQRAADLHSVLSSALHRIGVREPGDESAWSLLDLLQFSVERNTEMDKAESQRAGLEQDLVSLREEVEQAESSLREAEASLETWRSDWAAEMRRLGLQDNAEPLQANSVLSNINDLFQKSHDADGYRIRIEAIDRDCRKFQMEARALAERVAPDLTEHSVEDRMKGVVRRLQDARLLSDQCKSLLERIDDEAKKLGQFERAIVDAQAELDEMCRQAGCSQYDQLDEAARKSTRHQELRRQVGDLERQLLAQSGGASLDAFVAEVEAEAADVDALQPRIDEFEEELNRLNHQRDEALRQIEREENELKKIDGSGVAAEKAAQCESLAARLEEQLRELAVLRTASAVLNTGIERYRQKNQGPVLERASRHFSRITDGAFAELRADYDEGKPVLTGVRSREEKSVHVGEMSDGTCDQLYLALRLASLETWLEQHEPIPFIVDDVLLNFDDQRAIAALRALADLSERTQVIFFTHHQHLVEMARANLPDSQLFVHNL